MNIFKKTIFTGFAPNLTGQDTLAALSYIFFPWKWKNINSGGNIKLVQNKLQDYFGVKYAYAFDSGRSALYFALKALSVQEGDEVLVQAYTCMVVTNSIVHTGAKPIFVDVKNDFNMDPADLEKKITSRSKVLIVQHTFGLSADLDKLLLIAKKHNLKIIEDCAHSFGAKYNGKLLGTFGDIGMLSFGADKVLSCVRGGALITDDQEISSKIKLLQNKLSEPRIIKTIQHLLHYPFFYLGKKLYSIYLGKIILALAKNLNLINKIIYKQEKRAEQVDFYPSKLANSLAEILINQLQTVDQVNAHRKKIADFYEKNINTKIILQWKDKINKTNYIYLRYPVLASDSNKLLAAAKKQGIILGNWYNNVIAPKDIDMSKTGYEMGSCPNAEKLAKRSVNLPTNRNVTIEDAKRVVEVVNEFGE